MLALLPLAPLFKCCRQQVLLIKSFSNSWGFPRGKLDKHEQLAECAVRETLEESGYDCSSKVDDEQYIERLDGGGKVGGC